MCFGVCWTKHIGKFSKTFIKSKMQLASPAPSCVVNDLVCLLFPCTLRAVCSLPKMGPISLSLVYTDVNKAPSSRSLREHVFPKQREEMLSFLSTPAHPPSPWLTFSSKALPLPCTGPEGWSMDILGGAGLQYRPASLKNLNWVDCADSYKPLSIL